MRVTAERSGVVLLRKEDGTYIMADDEGYAVTNIPGEHRYSVRTTEFDDWLLMNKALNSKHPYLEVGKVIQEILEGRPKR